MPEGVIVKIPESLSLVLPVYNEANLVRSAVTRCIQVLSHDFEDFELILVDDGSTDGTSDIMDEFAKNDKRVRVLHNYINLNIGISVPRGLMIASKDFVIWNAVDLPLAVEDIAGLMQHMKKCDMLVLERKSYPGCTLWRLITSKINRILYRMLFCCSDIKDLNFTFICRRDIISLMSPLARSPVFTMSEMILRANRIGLRVRSVIVDYHPRPSGKGAFGKPHDILWSMYDTLRFRIKIWGKLKKRK